MVDLIDPYRGEVLAAVHSADEALVDEAISHALAGAEEMRGLPTHRRVALIRATAAAIDASAGELAEAISRQSGKALGEASLEINRTSGTFAATASALESLVNETAVADAFPSGEGLIAWKTREPYGVVVAITSFNAPLNLLAHKIAPALAMGNAVVIKPPPQAPISAYQLAEMMVRVGFPPNAVTVLAGDATVGSQLVRHSDVAAVSFTGSVHAGNQIAREAGAKRLVLELGGNSPNIVHEDADLEAAVPSLVIGAFSNAGQSCNSVQRVVVHRSRVQELTEALVDQARQLVTGDPLDPSTQVGTLIDEIAAKRVESAIDVAESQGAAVHLRGERRDALLPPCVLGDVTSDMQIGQDEIFGPVAAIMSYDDLGEAIQIANGTPYGLQSAVFTTSLDVAFRVARELRFGGVMVNRASRLRLDHLPFGGVKSSGIGRESAHDSLKEFSVEKLVLIDPGPRGRK
jgi:acyl-CoA reductase-like NAD-dependent aldehyde dehydrogenase